MSQDTKRLETEVLELPLQERARLARRLIVSLEDDADQDPVEVERAWKKEIHDRLAELDAGTAELIPAEQVLAELRDRTRG